MMLIWLVAIIAAFVCGSIPFGVLIARVKGVDIRAHGSGNPGATNVGRVLGRSFGVVCFVLDGLKGAAPVLIAGMLADSLGRSPLELQQSTQWLWLAVAISAVMGHMFSPFLKFRGGKGVATGFGALLAMFNILTYPALCALCIWLIAVRLWRMVSLASICASIAIPVAFLVQLMIARRGEQHGSMLNALPPFIVTASLAMLITIKHSSNIARIMTGTEPRIGDSGP